VGPFEAAGLSTRSSKGPPLLMLKREEDVDAHALHHRGWTISALISI
jgi:hypothetical protein